ncbi:MAG: aldehyde dehydrogenase family protein [Candidatus Brocadia sp.]|nr:aldehyde dehydrogenase family protein [Candidatus Brocadia sp.]
MAVDETGRGIYEDKALKNLYATENVYNMIKHEKTVGIIRDSTEDDYFEVVEPVGVIAAITPVTNPTSTTLFKSIIAVKSCNPIIFAFHRCAHNCSQHAAEIVRNAAVREGAPAHCIQWIETPSRKAITALLTHPKVAMILATGGASLVNAAYSSDKPAIGVGPGNTPCYIDKTADLRRTVTDLVLSKTFDNGMICSSEQSLVVDRAISDEVVSLLRSMGCYFLNPDEVQKLSAVAIGRTKAINPDIIGQPAEKIAEMAGLSVPKETKILIAPLDGVGPAYPLSGKKLSPILSLYLARNQQEAIERCEQIIAHGELGHTAVIHSEDANAIRVFSNRVRTTRLLANSSSSHGGPGDLYNTYVPSLTFAVVGLPPIVPQPNVSARDLINVKRVARRKLRLRWFKMPPEIYFEPGSLRFLARLPGKRAFVVAANSAVHSGIIARALSFLKSAGIATRVFQGIEADPEPGVVSRGAEDMASFHPDTIVAVGGGGLRSTVNARRSVDAERHGYRE